MSSTTATWSSTSRRKTLSLGLKPQVPWEKLVSDFPSGPASLNAGDCTSPRRSTLHTT